MLARTQSRSECQRRRRKLAPSLGHYEGSNARAAHLVVKALLDANANPRLKNNTGKDAITLTKDCIASIDKSSPSLRKKTTQAHFTDDYLEILNLLMSEATQRQTSLQSPLALKLG